MQKSTQGSNNQQDSGLDVTAYVQQAAHLLQLTIPPEQMAGVINNFEQIQTIAWPVLDFPIPDTVEAAPRFEP